MPTASLHVDVTREGLSGEITVSFATFHRYNAYMGVRGAGEHLYDSEMTEWTYLPVPGGRMRLKNVASSRHARGTEQDGNVCSLGRFQYDREGTHPVMYEARGGHALYFEPNGQSTRRTPRHTDSKLEDKTAATAERLERGIPIGGHYPKSSIGGLRAAREAGRCTAYVPPENIVGIGTLWNDSRIGANRDGALSPMTVNADVCVEQNKKPGRARMIQSVRWATGWMNQDRAALTRLGCGRAPGGL
jgi:hypothetical protein